MPELAKTILANSSNLKGYWKFETGALLADSSGNGHTLSNNTAVAETASGKFNYGASFNGSHYLDTVSTTDLNITGNITVGCWVYLNAVAEKGLVSKGLHAASTFQWALRVTSTSKFGFGVDSNGTWGPEGDAVGTTTPSTGQWYFVVGVYDGSAVRIYVDGKHESSVAYSGGIVSKTGNLFIGTYFDTAGTYFPNCVMDDVFVFNTALSADQIKELYEGHIYGELRPGQYGTNPRLYHLNGSSTDFSGNNGHGTDTAITYSIAIGKWGQGASFNGSSSRIDTSYNNTNQPKTFVLWAKSASNGDTSGSMLIGSQGPTDNDRFYLGFATTTGFLGIGIGTSGWSDESGGHQTSTAWNHYALTYASTTAKLYINGALVGSKTQSGSSSRNYFLGANNYHGGASSFWAGQMDEVAIYSVELTANQIRQIYAYQRGLLGRYA